MDKDVTSTLIFDSYVIPKINLNVNPDFDQKGPIDIDFKFKVSINVNEEKRSADVRLDSLIFGDAKEKNYPFTLELTIIGSFHTDSTLGKEELIKFCTINGTTALFPFLRAAISDITKTANLTPLILPLVNIYKLIEKQNIPSN